MSYNNTDSIDHKYLVEKVLKQETLKKEQVEGVSSILAVRKILKTFRHC